jgi:hypothetical protein
MKITSKPLAFLLEALSAFFFQTFGLGHLYAGNYIIGVLLMLLYWILFAINFALCFMFIGYVTMPLTWLLFFFISTVLLSRHLEEEK